MGGLLTALRRRDLQHYPFLSGTGEKTYSPAASITRADYLLLLVKTLGLTADFEGNFDDVVPGTRYYEPVGIAKELGIATGSGNNQFKPHDPISRQDMVVLTTWQHATVR